MRCIGHFVDFIVTRDLAHALLGFPGTEDIFRADSFAYMQNAYHRNRDGSCKNCLKFVEVWGPFKFNVGQNGLV